MRCLKWAESIGETCKSQVKRVKSQVKLPKILGSFFILRVMNFEEFKRDLNLAVTEEMVKATYARYFNVKYNTANAHDLYNEKVLFEFKTDKNLKNLKGLATVLAQALYYIHRIKFQNAHKNIPHYICLADKNEAVLSETNKWSNYYSSDAYDWQRAASKPDPLLVDHLVKEPETANIHVFEILKKQEHNTFKRILDTALNPQLSFEFGDKKVISEENFEAVYEHWKSIIGPYIVNGYKPSFYFLANIQREKIILDRENGKVVFTFEDQNSKTQKVLMKDYDYFWDNYEYVTKAEDINGIHSKLDRLSDESQRRFEGEFYTPLLFAQKAIDYWAETLGKNWYKTGKFRIWDMAAGTGNLEYHLPAEAYKYLYMSTLHGGEVDHLKKVFPAATCFQYDYLNDDIDFLFMENGLPFEPNWKLPEKLRKDLANPEITWIVYINPPFATAQNAKQKDSKTGVSKTRLELVMDRENIGHAKRELFAQFMYRIGKELPKKTFLGMFSKLKYLNSPDNADFRNKYFDFKFERGFIFKSTNFQGVTGQYPICFLIWDLSENGNQKIIPIDIADNNAKTIGTKYLRLINKKEVLNNWFERPKNSNEHILPPLSNALTVKTDNTDTRHRARPDFLGSVCSKGNDFQNAKYVTILSSPSVSAGAFTVTPEIFEKAMTLFAVRKIPRPTWLNDRDQFLIPTSEPTAEFMNDCVVWSLFSGSNNSSALRNVKYQNETYQIQNNFYPFLLGDLKNWEIKDPDIRMQLLHDTDRFAALWIKTNEISEEAKAVLEKAKKVYKIFYSNLNILPTQKWKIETWDAGWYQIRRCLGENYLANEEMLQLRDAMGELSAKIFPFIEIYGFLDRDEILE